MTQIIMATKRSRRSANKGAKVKYREMCSPNPMRANNIIVDDVDDDIVGAAKSKSLEKWMTYYFPRFIESKKAPKIEIYLEDPEELSQVIRELSNVQLDRKVTLKIRFKAKSSSKD